jgi:glycosyltransferase involved in cell wall biosynthesis
LGDLFLLPSDTESFGLAALEALSCGVPVLATQTGGLGELIQDGQNGFLFPVGETEKMAGQALELFRDGDQLAWMKKQARQSAVERFDAKHLVPLYEAYYQEVLGQ